MCHHVGEKTVPEPILVRQRGDEVEMIGVQCGTQPTPGRKTVPTHGFERERAERLLPCERNPETQLGAIVAQYCVKPRSIAK